MDTATINLRESDAAAGLTFVGLSLTKRSVGLLTEPTPFDRIASLRNGKLAEAIAGQMANKAKGAVNLWNFPSGRRNIMIRQWSEKKVFQLHTCVCAASWISMTSQLCEICLWVLSYIIKTGGTLGYGGNIPTRTTLTTPAKNDDDSHY